MALEEIANNYFSSINSMANRICVDLNETKTSYEDLWKTLPTEEQNQILTDSIIKPEVNLKYNRNVKKPAEVKREFAVKLVVDDHCSYRDEHSAPFNFRTESQRDLTIFQEEKKTVSVMVNRKEEVKPVKTVQQKVQKAVLEPPVIVNQPKLKQNVELNSSSDSLSQFLPKTGLDMLDNW